MSLKGLTSEITLSFFNFKLFFKCLLHELILSWEKYRKRLKLEKYSIALILCYFVRKVRGISWELWIRKTIYLLRNPFCRCEKKKKKFSRFGSWSCVTYAYRGFFFTDRNKYLFFFFFIKQFYFCRVSLRSLVKYFVLHF